MKKGQKLESSLSLVEETEWQKKAFGINDEVESLKHSFTVISGRRCELLF